ncbi:MAG: 2-oxoglutarate dehydrogenase, E2 component, dihydrolipoamide succinyltransferase [Rhodothermales bacterium]|nr:2-oxoglutarate dehydrogenase, E2 component, dihydrolipoamide succinyltransferase [Rhodothermales bacterium]
MAKVDVVMPKMGESVMEGTVLEWKKQVGDEVELDETLLEISTDKVDSEVPSPSAGRLAEILVQEGDTVEVGTPIAVIETDVDAPVGGDGAAGSPDAQAEAAESGADAEAAEEAAREEPEAKPAAPNIRPAEEAEQAAEATGAGAKAHAVPAVAGGERTEVVMPKMGESVMEGTVLEWKKQVGDEVELDETLLEISTDKVDSEVPSPAKGILAEVLVQEGETVEVGTPIAVIATGEGAAVGAPPSSAPQGQSGPSAEAPEPPEKGYSMPGQAIQGDGSELAEPAAAEVAEPGPTGELKRRGADGRFYSPLVRSIARAEGISQEELERIEGSGTEGRVTKQDVLGYLETRKTQPAPRAPERPAQPAQPAAPPMPRPQAAQAAEQPAEGYGDRVEVIEMDRMRQLIAEHMTRSKATSAHVTSFTEIDVTNLVKLRERRKAEFLKREGVKLTYTPFFVRAAVEALKTHPLLNASVEGKRILVKKDFHIGIAVAIGKKGLLVPIVRHAGQKNLTGLTHTIADVAERARNKQLMPDELQGGTFTVTNVGSLGSLMGTPIINQPQVAILSPGKIQKRPVVIEHPDLGDTIAIRQMMYVSLSYDHRIIDGAMGASFLQAYKEAIESIDPDEAI